MPAEREHHKSKKRGFSIVLVPNEDGSEQKTYRFASWQIMTIFGAAVVALIGAVIAAVVYTRLGTLLPITHPELENRYNRELISLYQQVAQMKGQLLELGSYNVKLRRALGENVTLTDSGVVNLQKARPNGAESRMTEKVEKAIREYEQKALELSSQQLSAKPLTVAASSRVSFPAILPTEGYITRGYEPAQRHNGLDIAGKTGTLVNAAADGYVVFSGWTHDDGNLVIISHPNGFLTFYKHNQSLLKSANTFVKRGEPIALLGSSGRTSSGPHLHFEIWKNGTPVDPSLFLLNLSL